MGSLKILYLTCFTILSLKIRGSQSRSFKDEGEFQEISDLTKYSNQLGVPQKCICFPFSKSGISITNYFSPDGEDDKQERLVVYFYRKSSSGKLTIFMPSLQKQLMLPDLTYDEGDRLETIEPEQLIDLFRNNKAYFTKIPHTIESVSHTIPDETFLTSATITNASDLENLIVPINTNEEKNEKVVLPENTNQYPFTSGDLSASENPADILDKIIPSNNRNKIMNLALENGQWHTKSTKTEDSEKSNQPLQGQYKQIQHAYNLPNNLNAPVSSNEPESGDQTYLSTTSNIPYRHIFSTKLDNLAPGENVEQIGPQQLPVVYKDLKVFPKFTGPGPGGLTMSESRPNIPSQLLPDNIPKYFSSLEHQAINNIPITSEEVNMPVYQSQNSKGSTTKYNAPKHIRPLPYYETDMTHPDIPDSMKSVTYFPSKYEHPVFDDWFINQMKSMHLKRLSKSKVIDFHSLKLLLVKALYENGIYMSKNGELYDSYGNVFKMTNIKLRPILLGNPMDYEKLMANSKCVIPYNIPYLEAVLVSFGNPPKVLALIPLRRIYVSKSPNNVISLDYINKDFDNARCGSHECAQSKFSEGPTSQFSDQTYSEIYNDNSGLIEGRSDGSEKEIIPIEQTSQNKDSSLHTSLKFDYTNLLSPLMPSFRSRNDDIAYKVGDNDIESKTLEDFDVPHQVANKPDEEDYDSLRIRIIGGNPATSSGTPVSSKGRSGLNMSIL